MARPNVLVIDVGGTNVKLGGTGRKDLLRFKSGPDFTAEQLVAGVKNATSNWSFDVVSMGFPASVRDDAIQEDPPKFAPGWAGYDFAKAFGKPTRIVNDAAMQALGSYVSGKMLFLGLGTGLGAALVVDGVVLPLQLLVIPYKKGMTMEDYVGLRGLERMGKKKWRHHVEKVVGILKYAFQADQVVLGGGQVKLLKKIPEGVTLGNNSHAIDGGIRLWDPPARVEKHR